MVLSSGCPASPRFAQAYDKAINSYTYGRSLDGQKLEKGHEPDLAEIFGVHLEQSERGKLLTQDRDRKLYQAYLAYTEKDPHRVISDHLHLTEAEMSNLKWEKPLSKTSDAGVYRFLAEQFDMKRSTVERTLKRIKAKKKGV